MTQGNPMIKQYWNEANEKAWRDMSHFSNLNDTWEVTGPPEIEKAGKWKVFWCKHPFTSEVRKVVCIRYPDIAYYQCKDCGAWCNFPDPGYAGRLFKAMVTGDNRHAFKDYTPRKRG